MIMEFDQMYMMYVTFYSMEKIFLDIHLEQI